MRPSSCRACSRTKGFLGLAALLVPAVAGASGFDLHDLSVRSMGMGGAFTAVADDPSAVYFNPAGLGFGTGGAAEVDLVGIQALQSYTDPRGVQTQAGADNSLVPSLYGRTAFGSDWNLGFGAYVPFATTWAWPQGWEGRSIITGGSLNALYLTPSIAWKPVEGVSLGAGVSYVHGNVDLKQQIPAAPGENVDAELLAGSDSMAFSVGALWKGSSIPLSVGATYRSQALLRLHGNLGFNPPPPLAASFPDGSVDVDVPLPDEAVLGAAWRPAEAWTVSAEGQWTGWAQFRRLVILPATGLPDRQIPIEADWMDTWTGRIGAEWRVLPTVRARAGYSLDGVATPRITLDPFSPEAPRQQISAGGDVTLGMHQVGIVVSVVPYQQRSTWTNLQGFNGTYRTLLYEAGLSYQIAF